MKCLVELPYIGERYCYKCGKQLENEQFELCHDCEKQEHFFRKGRGVFVHENLICDAIYDLKYQNKRQVAGFFANQMWNSLGNWIMRGEYQGILPVPLSKTKLKARGYNQAELLSGIISEKSQIRHVTNYLERVSDTAPQRLLGRQERKNNLKNAFKTKPDRLQLEKVLLVDDIYTTGNTIDAISEVLLNDGVKFVDFITISIGKGL